jgi:Fe-S-cluster-containing dehydrogenase component
MSINRREFLRRSLGGAAAGAAATTGSAEASTLARPDKQLSPEALGILYDSTLCVGCKACVAACKRANGQPPATPAELAAWNEGTWDSAQDLDGRTLNVIKAYVDGTRAVKDREKDGFAFVKRHCLHCVDPSCVSVCPVSAMKKDAKTGIVTYDKDACIGCRYCSYGCPFGVPQFDLTVPFGRINKCELCSHLLAKGEIPACCDVCPTGASLFGPVAALQKEADARLAAKPGSRYDFPRGSLLQKRPKYEGAVGQYAGGVYGVKEAAGVQVRYLAAVPFDKLGLPKLPAQSFAAISEGVQHTLYKGMIAPLVLLGGLVFLAWRAVRRAPPESTPTDPGKGKESS